MSTINCILRGIFSKLLIFLSCDLHNDTEYGDNVGMNCNDFRGHQKIVICWDEICVMAQDISTAIEGVHPFPPRLS